MIYKRDQRSPMPKNSNISKIMSANKAKNSKPELLLRSALWKKKLLGYRLHPKSIEGKPDVCYISKKVAIFVHGCYWHRCPTCAYPLPKHNTDFWKQKFSKNVSRDQLKTKSLRSQGWKVMIVWECQLLTELEKVLDRIEGVLKK